jgi:Cu-Zn family superoxide dismutase
MKRQQPFFVAVLALSTALIVAGCGKKEEKVTIKLITPDGVGDSIGTVTLTDSEGGLVLTPDLTGLPPGDHGFHVHDKGECGPGEKDGTTQAGMAAGGHFDPNGTGRHLGPESAEGHEGDLPVLSVGADGRATKAVTAPHLKLEDAKGHALMIHAGADNYSDAPAPLGGGGARIACGVID